MKNIINYDILKSRYRFGSNDLDNVLLLHPSVIEGELEKIKSNSPFYFVAKNGELCTVFIPNKEITEQLYTYNMRRYIPSLIPVGGVDGKYSLSIFSSIRENKEGSYKYEVIDNESGRTLLFGKRLSYLGKDAAEIDKFIITKKQIFPCDDRTTPIFFPETGCLVLSVGEGVDTHYLFYDSESNFVTTAFIYNDIFQINEPFPKLPKTNYPKNAELFEQMIVASLRDTDQLEDCASDNLVDIANHFHEKGLEVAIDLNSLTIHKVNYERHFRKINSGQNPQSGPQYVYKNSGNGSNA